ncbi:DegT/DnrJ/EryC1/StrS aminotransferase family protein [Xenophilus sp. Marseille-Q4582]|uniref:DegT/DnrJ/EryC1/StrS family aminotransferase n=1 Tax=Xenophilus sp. Marseille-Q4582 TaxID=2866600 RepID=UPI001CE3CFC7|nr:DegT/DnrJ/EryC1/StrS family aminotransferase [Xenophilus sp. Marseille-Q4582]
MNVSAKRIRSVADLATNGAQPAFAQPLHVGRPNIGNRDAFLASVNRLLDDQWLTNNGPLVQEFEKRIAGILGVKHCVAMCNGTIALEIAIRALGLTGEVIVPSWTFVATAHALHWQGITPVFADIDPNTHNLDPLAVRRMITPRTSGIIGVHLWGRAAPVDELQEIADEHRLKLMFDAAHAFGSSYGGRSIGSFGACEVFSFHATKAFNTMEGGAVTTDDDELAEAMRLMRNFGFEGYDNVIHPGTNGKMIEVCAAMGLANLDEFDAIVAANKRTHTIYRHVLAGIPGISLLDYGSVERNSHHYVVAEVDEDCPARRDDIIAALHAENILARKYFWPGSHRMQPYRDLFPHAGLVLPQTTQLAERVMVLPAGACMTSEQIQTVGDVIRHAVLP